jgi:hypothetical protein
MHGIFWNVAMPDTLPVASAPAMPAQAAARWPARMLLLVSWLSAAIFSLYIVIFYGGAALLGTMARDWNEVLPRLYAQAATTANLMIGMHFVSGAAVLVLGPAQFLSGVRTRWPAAHRWSGRIYLGCAALAGIGGLTYLALRDPVGGPMMALGFGLYGVLMLLACAQTLRHALARRMPEHRAWAIRLFTLGLGSWLYRMEYGLWLNALDWPGHASGTFDGPFDLVMDFFYVPHLLVAEYCIRRRPALAGRVAKAGGAVCAMLLAVVTWLFASAYWLPHVRDQFARLL